MKYIITDDERDPGFEKGKSYDGYVTQSAPSHPEELRFTEEGDSEPWATVTDSQRISAFRRGEEILIGAKGSRDFSVKVQKFMFKKKAKKKVEHDPVNKPKHYNSHPSGVECIEIKRHMTPNVGDVFKYLWRAGLKDSVGMDSIDKAIQDHEKAAWYLNDEIKMLKNIRENGGTYNPNCDLYGKGN